MCRIDLCGQIGVKIGIYGDRIFLKWDPLNRPWGRFLRREDTQIVKMCTKNGATVQQYEKLKIKSKTLMLPGMAAWQHGK